METQKLKEKLYQRAITATEDDVFYKRLLHKKLTEIRVTLESECSLEELPYTKRLIKLVDGWDYQTVAHIENIFDILLLDVKAHKEFPAHSHGKKQIVHVLSGIITYTVNGEPITLTQGDQLTILSNTVHSAYPEADCKIFTIFLPPITVKLISHD